MAVKTSRADALTWTLGVGVADTMQFLDSPSVPFMKVINLDATNAIWVRRDGAAAVIEAEGCIYVPPGTPGATGVVVIAGSVNGAPCVLSIISVAAAKVSVQKATRPFL